MDLFKSDPDLIEKFEIVPKKNQSTFSFNYDFFNLLIDIKVIFFNLLINNWWNLIGNMYVLLFKLKLPKNVYVGLNPNLIHRKLIQWMTEIRTLEYQIMPITERKEVSYSDTNL